MRKSEIMRLLLIYYKEHAKEHGIRRLGVFGSVARDCADENSDVDIVVDLDIPKFFEMAAIKQELEDMLHKPVDLVRLRDRMNLFLKQKIEDEAVYVR